MVLAAGSNNILVIILRNLVFDHQPFFSTWGNDPGLGIEPILSLSHRQWHNHGQKTFLWLPQRLILVSLLFGFLLLSSSSTLNSPVESVNGSTKIESGEEWRRQFSEPVWGSSSQSTWLLLVVAIVRIASKEVENFYPEQKSSMQKSIDFDPSWRARKCGVNWGWEWEAIRWLTLKEWGVIVKVTGQLKASAALTSSFNTVYI